MSAPTIEVLAAHIQVGPLGACKCGWVPTGWSEEWPREHRAHVAQALAPVLAAVVREAEQRTWDEGVGAAFRGAITRQNAEDVKRRNPYRTDGGTT